MGGYSPSGGNRERKIAALALGLTLGLGIAFSSGVVFAAKPGPAPTPHRHYVMVNDEKVYVGPNFCATPASEQGWIAYHHKVHLGGNGEVFPEPCAD